jgi:hypothetical protein
MMSKGNLFIRFTAVTLLVLLFAYGAFYLYKKQQSQINYLSFQISEDATSLLVSDLDKFKTKTDAINCIQNFNIDSSFVSGFELFFNADINLADEDLKSCMFSFDSKGFLFAFQTSLNFKGLTSFLVDRMGASCVLEGGVLSFGTRQMNLSRHEGFLLVSSIDFMPKASKQDVDFTSADIIEYSSGFSKGKKHILSNQMHYQVWSEEKESLKGRPVNSEPFFNIAPSKFSTLTFYGSSRMLLDNKSFFESPNQDGFDWLGDGLLHCEKDSFEIVIARPNSDRDLGLILEEQTLSQQSDSVLIPYFNIGKFKVLSFKTTFNWKASIKELNNDLGYYTEYNNFNILANSIPAMRWYLSQVQLGNLLEGNPEILDLYRNTAPTISHIIRIHKNEEEYSCRSEVFQRNNLKLVSLVELNTGASSVSGVEVVHEFALDFSPDRIQLIENKGLDLLLLSNDKRVELVSEKGELIWFKDLSSSLVSPPQVVDFENDGEKEYVLFQEGSFDVVGQTGKSRTGFPVNLNEVSSAGLAVNYDKQYVYRIIVSAGTSINVYNEDGAIVEGWMFNEMTAGIKSEIYHVLTAGKDIIAFKDLNNKQFILNRKGESRLTDAVAFSLKNETDFIVGGMESSLRKMGYSNGFILNYYVLDGERDSVKIDQNVAPIAVHWEYNSGDPLLILEEPNRLLIVDQFGYLKSEVLKPSPTNNFVGLVGIKEYGFVFSDSSQNTIYLLNNYGKMLLPNSVQGSSVCAIHGELLYTVSGVTLKAYKIKN